MNNYNKSVEEVIEEFSSCGDGLEESEAKKRFSKYGPNKINQEDSNHPILIFLSQFKNGLVYVLIVAAIIAAIFGKWIDVYVIAAIVLINSILGFFQEYKAEKAVDALMDMIVPMAKVFRAGELMKIPAEEIVPGDVLFLEEGDKIPADVRLIDVRNFRTKEATLTGEASPRRKTTEALEGDIDLGDRKNMAWMGTFVAGGTAKGLVVATGDDTIFGEIAKDIGDIEKSGGHFEEKISVLAKQMALFAFTGAGLIFVASAIRNKSSIAEGLESFEEPLFAAIASLVSGIPEGLPAIAVIVLAVGATRMANRNAIIRKLPATETLGVADHILTDKTGTITQNTMTVKRVALANDLVKVTGEGWDPKGKFYIDNKIISPLENPDLDKLLHIAEVCNQAELSHKKNAVDEYEIIGDPTEGGLVVLAEKAGLRKEVVSRDEQKLDDMPFNSKIKMRASLVRIGDKKQIYAVGAPEKIIESCDYILENGEKVDMTTEKRKEMISCIEEMSEKAMRAIGLAYGTVENGDDRISKKMLSGLVLSGVVGMIDPPRPGVEEAIKKASSAGVRVVMVTGDHKKTAAAIAEKVGIVGSNKDYPVVMDQSDLEKISEVEFRDKIKNVNVFARLTPHMKLKIAETLQEEGAIIAMTGDGVNDAPAVKRADIGLAMGIMGTDVTKEAGDIVLADDNFASIVNAIEEGRTVFENTRKASSSLITSNFGEMGTIITSIILGYPLPLLPTQILWVNLVTDGVMGIPLALEPAHENILNRPPRKKEENILTKEIIPYLLIMTVIMVVTALFIFDHFLFHSLEKARTGAFSVIAFTQLFNAINLRSIKKSVFEIGFFSNRYIIIGFLAGVILQLVVIWAPSIRDLFHFYSLSGGEVLIIAALSSSVFVAGEIYKKIRYRNDED